MIDDSLTYWQYLAKLYNSEVEPLTHQDTIDEALRYVIVTDEQVREAIHNAIAKWTPS